MPIFGKYQVKPPTAPGGFDPKPVLPVLPAPKVVRLGSGEKFQLLPPQHQTSGTQTQALRSWDSYQSFLRAGPSSSPHTLPYVGSSRSPRSIARFIDDMASDYDYSGAFRREQELLAEKTAEEIEQEILQELKIKVDEDIQKDVKTESLEAILQEDSEDPDSNQISAIQVFEQLRQNSLKKLFPENASFDAAPMRRPLKMPEPITSPIVSLSASALDTYNVARSPFEDPQVGRVTENSADSHGSQMITSPQPLLSFSPEDAADAQRMTQISFTLGEIVDSEYTYVKSLSLLGNYLVEPLLERCRGFRITCTPLVNINIVIRSLHERHRRFLSRVATERDLCRLAEAIVELVSRQLYVQYAACAELVLFLVSRHVRPFESAYVDNLQGFLERNQPGEHRMDLSLHSLIQKPLGRVAKYGLFLSSLSRLSLKQTFIKNACKNVNNTVLQLNSEISSTRERHAVLVQLAQTLDLTATKIQTYQFYGLLNLCGTCTVSWRSCTKKGPSGPVSRPCHVLVHERHMIVNDVKSQKLLFIASFPNSQLITDAGCSIDGGLYRHANKKAGIYESFENFRGPEKNPLVMKLLFEKDGCRYELLFESYTADAHAQLLRACETVPRQHLSFKGISDGDCYVGPPLASYDINLKNTDVVGANYGSCYFREPMAVPSRNSTSRFHEIGVAFKRTFAWQNQ